MNCPKCNEECDRDSVDVGIGIIYGPYGCPNCYWSEDRRYDFTDPDFKQPEDGYVDQYGGFTRKKALGENDYL